jgi:hypothetical protein
MDAWGEYVRGRTIAVVGPAPAVGDQSEEVDSHDIVIRVGYRSDLQEPPQGYGSKLDAVFYNYLNSRKLGLGLYDEFIFDIPWVLVKKAYKPPENVQNYVVLRSPFSTANQVPILLNDLVKNGAKEIAVFGTDLYLGGPEFTYSPGYNGWVAQRIWWEIKLHKPNLQHAFLRSLYKKSGAIKGDDRFLTAMNMTTKSYMKLLTEKWEGK